MRKRNIAGRSKTRRKKTTQSKVSLKKKDMSKVERAEKSTIVLEEAKRIADNRIGRFVTPREIVTLMIKEELIEKTEVWGKKLPTMAELSKMLKDWESFK